MNKSTFDSLMDGVYDCMGVQRSVEDGGTGSGKKGHTTNTLKKNAEGQTFEQYKKSVKVEKPNYSNKKPPLKSSEGLTYLGKLPNHT
jgi:hypothetical protein